MTYSRGTVWFADIPGVGEKPVVIVSAEPINRALDNVITARIMSVDRERSLPTHVAIEPGELEELPKRSFAICHDLFTLPKLRFRRRLGSLAPPRVIQLEAALRRALDL